MKEILDEENVVGETVKDPISIGYSPTYLVQPASKQLIVGCFFLHLHSFLLHTLYVR